MKALRPIFFWGLLFLPTIALSSCVRMAPKEQTVYGTTEIAKMTEVVEADQPAPAPSPWSVESPIEQPVQPPGLSLSTATPLSEISGSANEPVEPAPPIQILPTQFEPATQIPRQSTSIARSNAQTKSSEPTISPATPTLPMDDHIIQVEWPIRIRLGESDVVRLRLIPSNQSYILITEYPEHQVVTQTVTIQHTPGYELYAVARLDGVGFDISPEGEQSQYLSENHDFIWRWSLTPRQSGNHRLSINLIFRWMPAGQTGRPIREVVAYSRSLDVTVSSFMGLTTSQTMATGWIAFLLGSGLSLLAIVIKPKQVRPFPALDFQSPNQELSIELPNSLHLSIEERSLLQSLFGRYSRLVIEQEFLSGYSGARTFLTLPVRSDGRNDAYTIAKIGERQAILKEYENYEIFVKDTLPPITARIQRPPVSTKSVRDSRLAAIQYTFIGEPGRPPTSMYKLLCESPDPSFISRLLDTFGPNWWLQRKPFTFRIALEYDRVLPTHYVIEPEEGKGIELDGHLHPGELELRPGQLITLRNFASAEKRLDGESQSLLGYAISGQPPLRVRWLSPDRYDGASGRIIATRQTLLKSVVEGFHLFGLSDPLERVADILSKIMIGSQSILHGDLNLENILIGPGNMLWLIDFAQTREGHTLFDFSHLSAEIIAHIAPRLINDPEEFLLILHHASNFENHPLNNLLEALDNISNRLLFNPAEIWEYRLTLAISCLGALKYFNQSAKAKHLLYLTAADILNEYSS
jgi:Ternary complex associated domain 9